MQSEGSLPKEHPRRRPPPSTSCLSPGGSCRLQRPLFGWSKTAVEERFAPVQLLAFVQLGEERTPDIQPDALLPPIPQPPPAGRRVRELVRQILPASATAQDPQNAFQHLAVEGSRSPAVAMPSRLGQQGPNLFPLRVGQQATVSRHRPSPWRCWHAYAPFREHQLQRHQRLVPSFATASSFSGISSMMTSAANGPSKTMCSSI